MTPQAALKILQQSDHVFLTPKAATDIQIAFGITPTLQTQRANTGAFKGLTVPGAKRNAKVQGYDAADLACDICFFLKIEYVDAFGRGTRLRNACEAIEASLKEDLLK
jgi:hypothetical protein